MLFTFSFAQANNKDISLQLVWKHQFQFAGYYIAKEKGYYNQAGLDVTIKEFEQGINAVDDVLKGKSDFAVGRSSLILDRLNGKPIVLLSAIFQHSPVILLSKKRSDISSLSDLSGKNLMFTSDQVGIASVQAMLLSAGVSKDKYKVQEHTFNTRDLVAGKTDAMLAYASNEPFELQQKGIDFTSFKPRDHGFDLYSDILYTSQGLIDQSPGVVKSFNKVSLQGWKYAMSHLEETVDLILKKYNAQNKTRAALTFEAKAMIDLIDQGNAKLGDIDPHKIEKNIQLYRLMGLVQSNKSIKDLIYKENRQEAKSSQGLSQSSTKFNVKNFIQKIKTLVARRLYDIDTEELYAELKPYLLDTPWIKTISIVESIDNEKVFSFYSDDGKNYVNQHLKNPLPIKSDYKHFDAPVAYKNEMVGTIIIAYEDNNSSISLTDVEKKWIKNNTVSIGIEPWPPMVYFKDGKAEGLVGDFLNLVIDKIGLKVKLVDNSWDQLLNDFKAGKLDVLPGTFFTPEREQYGIYSPTFFAVREKIYVRNDNKLVTSFASLKDKKLALVKGFGTIAQIKTLYPSIDIVETDSFRQSVQFVLNGKVDALFESEVSTNSFLNEQSITGLKSVTDLTIEPNKLHFFSSKNKPILSQILNKGLDSISAQEKNIIINSWSNNNSALILTDKEQQWLTTSGSINYVYDPDWAPYEFTNDVGQHAGIISDILKKVQITTGIQFNPIKTNTWGEAVKLAQNRDADMYSGVGETADRKKYMNFSTKKIFTTPYVFVSRAEDDYLSGFDDLNAKEGQKRIAVINDYTIHGIMLKNRPDIKLTLLSTVSQAFKQLVDKKIDVFVVNTITAKHYLKNPQYKTLKLAYKTEFNLSLKIGLRNDWPKEPLSIIDKAIETFTQEDFEKIYNKWTKNKTENNVDYELLIEVALGFIVLIAGFIVWNRKLNTLVKEKTQDLENFSAGLEKQIKKRTKDLNRQLKISQIAERKQNELIVKMNEQRKIIQTAQEKLVSEIADRKQSEYMAEHAKKRLENITNNIPGVVFQFQSSGDSLVVKFVSDGIKKLQNLEPTELLNNFELFVESIYPDDQGIVLTAIADSIRLNKQLSCEYRVLHEGDNLSEDLNIYWVSLNARISKIASSDNDVLLYDDENEENKDVLFNGNLIDITDTKLAHEKVLKQQKEINDIHKHTRESIEYAALIQSALIPDNKVFQQYFKESFAIWHPKDIVGGDIYLVEAISEHEIVVMVIDCTGHGVPGAFVTMLVKAIERQLMSNIHQDKVISPAKILSIFNRSIKHLLKQEDIESISNAGFDGGILYYNKKESILRFAGAETPLFIYQEGELQIIKGNRHSIGYKKSNVDYQFTDHEIDVSIPTQIYLTTDGYLDQNGGNKSFPFGKKRFKQLIETHVSESFADQQEYLLYELSTYQQNEERNDDVTVLGLRL